MLDILSDTGTKLLYTVSNENPYSLLTPISNANQAQNTPNIINIFKIIVPIVLKVSNEYLTFL